MDDIVRLCRSVRQQFSPQTSPRLSVLVDMILTEADRSSVGRQARVRAAGSGSGAVADRR